jgi:hypothetical protein
LSWGRQKRSNNGLFYVRPSDYFQGDIMQGNKKVAVVHGSYLGYINVDNTRYWDYRFIQPYKVYFIFEFAKINTPDETLESDMRKRIDLLALKTGDIAFAQAEKEKLEEI